MRSATGRCRYSPASGHRRRSQTVRHARHACLPAQPQPTAPLRNAAGGSACCCGLRLTAMPTGDRLFRQHWHSALPVEEFSVSFAKQPRHIRHAAPSPSVTDIERLKACPQIVTMSRGNNRVAQPSADRMPCICYPGSDRQPVTRRTRHRSVNFDSAARYRPVRE